MTTCNCSVCSYYARVKSAIDSLPEQHREFFNSMYDDYVHLQSKYNYQRAIIDGSWPNADEVIKHKRERHAIRNSRQSEAVPSMGKEKQSHAV